MPSPKRVKRFLADLATVDDAHFCAAMANAVRLGIGDARKGKPARSGREIIETIGFSKWHEDHERMFRAAYGFGRQQVVLQAETREVK